MESSRAEDWQCDGWRGAGPLVDGAPIPYRKTARRAPHFKEFLGKLPASDIPRDFDRDRHFLQPAFAMAASGTGASEKPGSCVAHTGPGSTGCERERIFE